MKHLSLAGAALLSTVAGAYLIHRHDGRLDDVGGLLLLGFALVCMAPARFHCMREELGAAWKTFKNPGGGS